MQSDRKNELQNDIKIMVVVARSYSCTVFYFVSLGESGHHTGISFRYIYFPKFISFLFYKTKI